MKRTTFPGEALQGAIEECIASMKNKPITVSWMQLIDGTKFSFDGQKRFNLSPERIAHVLTRILRFGGHTRWPYSVAQHSILVAEHISPTTYSPQVRMWGLLHDAHEVVTGDVIYPLKKHFGCRQLSELADAVDLDIATYHDLLSVVGCKAVKFSDDTALATEARDLMLPAVDQWTDRLPEPWLEKIVPWHPDYVFERFLNTYYEILTEYQPCD